MKTALAVLNRRTLLKAGIPLLAMAPFAQNAASSPSSTPAPIDVCAATPIDASATPNASPAAMIEVIATNSFTFDPAEITVRVGETATWSNESWMPHTVTCDPDKNPVLKTQPELVSLPKDAEPWASELLQPGDSFSHTFTTLGEYAYICVPHVLSGMAGKVTVVCG